MRVCFFSGDITRGGGTERIGCMLANAFARMPGYHITVLSIVMGKEQPFFPLLPDIERCALNDRWLDPGIQYLKLVPRLRRFLRSRQIDVIVDIDIVLDAISIPAVCGRRRSTRVLSFENFSVSFERSILYRRAIMGLSARCADYSVVLTQRDLDFYRTKLGRRDRIMCIHNPMPDIEPPSGEKREKWILTAGHLTSVKGMDYLAEVASIVLPRHPDWQWLVLGDGPMRPLLESTAEADGLRGRLVLVGRVENVLDYFSRARIYVLTSRTEGLSMSLLEAKASHVPSVAFNVPSGPAEIIRDGRNGYLVPPFDCGMMAEKIEALMDDVLWQEYSENTVLDTDKFQSGRILEQWKEALSHVCREAVP